MAMAMTLDDEARDLLRRLTGDPAADFRDGQLEAIKALVEEHRKVLVVQRTGWGKSAVYFVATRLLRARGAGPTVLVSPLLALMRNQVMMAERGGVRAATINSGNRDEWDAIEAAIAGGDVDLLLISPERLNNLRFREEVMPDLISKVGLLVVDEAHCISDWGHDFRPDYRRLARVLPLLPPSLPVLCTTATANDRVVADIVDQLGSDLAVVRGGLDRTSLRLSVLDLPQQADRLAWLADAVPRMPGSGIVYCLTIADTERVADWFRKRGINALAYSGDSDTADRPGIEDALLANDVKVVVATSALGMGFDKPDLSFVVHYQSPGSPIAYYQQVGRAGRGVPTAHGVLLRGHEDADIQDYFIRTAFPPRDQAEAVLAVLDGPDPVSLNTIKAAVNIRHTRLEGMLKVLEVEGAVARSGTGWRLSRADWVYDDDRVANVTAIRRAEQAAMVDYATTSSCRMQFLRRLLDDAGAEPCGRCDNCTGESDAVDLDPEVVADAQRHLRSRAVVLPVRKRWPYGLGAPRGNIAPGEQLAEGRALALGGDGGWGSVVRACRNSGEPVPGELLEACVRILREWQPDPPFAWVAAVPSTARGPFVTDLASRLAAALDLPFHDVVLRTRTGPPQHEMQNSAQQVANVHGAFAVSGEVPPAHCLLIDDVADSGWTLAVVGAALRAAGSGPVSPFVLVRSAGE